MAKAGQIAKRQASKIESADRKLARATGASRDSHFMKALGFVSDLADQPPLVALSALTIGAGIVTGRKHLARAGVRMLLSHLAATQVKSFVKGRVDRTRPFVMLDGGRYHGKKGRSSAKSETSFPSGHTAGAVAVARAVAREYPEHAGTGYALAATAAAVQIPRGTHFASDIVAGALIGLVTEALVTLVLPTRDKLD
ncbi:phosphatase PAP2 family protein [Sphingomonas sp.]|uniref:phosphatase PAP2 family protein n=1 Tax=Sphingomonas sp. TaxID=28214 RepID=UPI0025E352D7|nr:phosphatase PAP2 family protein [Sphingomonas sp.]